MRSSRFPLIRGRRLTTGTARSGTGPGSRTSPGCWTFPPGRPECGSSSARNARTPARSCGSPTSTGTGSPPSPPAPGKGSSPTWIPSPAPGPLRGPDPLRQGHRAAEPAAQELRPEPDLVRDRRPGLRAARTDRRGPPLETETAPPAAVLRCRPAGPRRPPPAAAARCTLAPARPDHRCHHPPAGPAVRLTSRNRHCNQGRSNPGPAEPRPPGATAGQPGTACTRKSPPAEPLRPGSPACVGSGAGAVALPGV
jgi:hypothetical protein